MHRSHAGGGGALASLTANYTDSDGEEERVNDNEEDSDENEKELVGGVARLIGPTADHLGRSTVIGGQNVSETAVLNPAPSFTVSPVLLIGLDTNMDDSQRDMMMIEDANEMGHITDEDQSDHSPETEDENIKDVLIYDSDVDDVQIPPEPVGRCANHLQEKFSQYYERMLREGLDLNATIQNQKQFRNPSIYEKLIQFCQIDELGTNYAPEVYDPGQFQNGPFYEDLAKAQKTEMDKRMKEHKDRTKIEFVTGTAKKTSAFSSSFDDEGKRRKSKWDVAVAAPIAGQASGLVPITSVTSGTKVGTKVISAFGTIAKKGKP